ncbi:MAG: hypothetical protein ACLPN1_18910 [Dissulfurispiraceae bacterium]
MDKAAEDFGKAEFLKIDNPRAYFYRIMATMMAGKNEAAILDFNKAMDLKAGFSLALLARCTAYSQLNRIDEAAADIRKLVPHLDSNLQSFVDTYGMVRTEMWKVMPRSQVRCREKRSRGLLMKWRNSGSFLARRPEAIIDM